MSMDGPGEVDLPLSVTNKTVLYDEEDTVTDDNETCSTENYKSPFATLVSEAQTSVPLTSNGPNGLKRPATMVVPGTILTNTQGKKSKPNQFTEITAEMIQEMDPNISLTDANHVISDYKHARRLMKKHHDTKFDCNPSVEYMIRLINEWKPRSEIICMYVRWSKRLRRNYHLDSISTLLCVSKQCEYKPHVFLKNIKTLTVCQSTTTYGISFKFHTCKSETIDGSKLNNQFLGLSITLRLLQRGIVSNNGTLGNVGLKKATGKTAASTDSVYLNVYPNANKPSLVATQPTSRFHTNAGLIGRIWLAIQHRWISIQVVEMLFELQLAHAMSEQESLAFSFQMHSASGPTRFDFLDPLIGVCLRFRSTSIINNQASALQSVWDNPNTFVSFGNAFLRCTTPKDMEHIITDNFQGLKDIMKGRTKLTIHRKTEKEVKWQMIRAYAFHFWLESTKNELLKTAVDRQCRKSPRTRKVSLVRPTYVQQDSSRSNLDGFDFISDGTTCNGPSQDETSVNTSMHNCGLSQLLSTRRVVHLEPSSACNTTPRCNPTEVEGMSPSPALATMPAVASIDPSIIAWNSIRLATLDEMSSLVSSRLLIHREDGVDLIEELAPLEVYSADLLHKRRHSRWTGQPGEFPASELGNVQLSISADVDKYIDHYSNSFHVGREDSYYFQEHEHLIPSIDYLSNLCQAILKYGKMNNNRSTDQFRINIGCGGQHKPSGIPEVLIGLSFKSSLASDTLFDDEEILVTIGKITEFTWNVLCDMQADASDIRLAPDAIRQLKYARHLSKYLQAKEDIGFEDITIVVGVLYPSMPQVTKHVDSMNDSVAGYTRTGAFNVVLCIGEGSDIILLHLQVICNFRRVIREYLFPFRGFLANISDHCRVYMAQWQQNINEVYGGKTEKLPIPFDRSNFFLDDCLPFSMITITSSKTEKIVTGEYLLTEISPSRVMSLSMFIDPIRELNGILCYDQQLELCFIASVLSNPFWFEYTITSLTRKHTDKDDPFIFNPHPLYDWSTQTITVFGSWQGGPHNRWSPFGGSTPFPVLFGANVSDIDLERKKGCTKLEAIVEILYHHLKWIDSYNGKVQDVTHDLPLCILQEHMMSVTEAIFQISPCQFSVFRLMVFTTVAIGCGMVRPGIHLKAMMYPVSGSASYKHLMNPNKDEITHTQALSLCVNQALPRTINEDKNEGVDPKYHDQLMLYLSTELGMRAYLRDETECILCESHPNRNLQCRDWFKKGRRIYDLDQCGNILQRDYGMNSQWTEVVSIPMEKMAFINL